MTAIIQRWFLILLALILSFFSKPTDPKCISYAADSADQVMAAVSARDADALESFMCQELKDTPDIQNQIEEFFRLIEGDIVEVAANGVIPNYPGNYYHETKSGKTVSQSVYNVKISLNTTDKFYSMQIIWEDINTLRPEELGIRCISLVEHGYTGYSYQYNEPIYGDLTLVGKITATGIGEWHE